MEMNIDAPNWVPVVYKTEIEPSTLSGFIPTLLIIGKFDCGKKSEELIVYVFNFS